MNRSAFVSLLIFGAAGTTCALLIAGTYMLLHIPLPFSVILSCVIMTTAVAMMAFRVTKGKARPAETYAFAPSTQEHAAPFGTPAENRVVMLAAARDDEHASKEEAPRSNQPHAALQIEAITLFELPGCARQQEAA